MLSFEVLRGFDIDHVHISIILIVAEPVEGSVIAHGEELNTFTLHVRIYSDHVLGVEQVVRYSDRTYGIEA